MSFIKTTEQDSNYNHLEKMSITEVLTNINNEDKTVAFAIEKGIPQIAATHQCDRSSTQRRRTTISILVLERVADWEFWTPLNAHQHLVFHQV